MFSCRVLLKPRGAAFRAGWQTSRGCHCSGDSNRFSPFFSQIPDQAENRERYTEGGKQRLAELMEHNIGLNSELKLVQSLHWKDFSVSIATRHVVQWTDLGYFTTASLAYAEAVCRRYMADNAKPLWWRTQTIGATVRPILRTKARARMNAAFREALLNAGYDTQGRRLPGQQEQTRSGNKATKGLTGTVVIKSHLPIETHKIPYSDLLEYCERVVEAVEQANRRRSGDTGKEPKAGQESRPGDRGHKGRGSRGGSGGSEGRGGRGSAAKKAGESSQRRPQRTWNHRDTT